MGWVDIPPPPQGAGRVKVTLQLDAAELQQTIALLKQAHQRLLQQGGLRGVSQPQAPVAQPPALPGGATFQQDVRPAVATAAPPPPAPGATPPVQQMQNLSVASPQPQWAAPQPAVRAPLYHGVPPVLQPGVPPQFPGGMLPPQPGAQFYPMAPAAPMMMMMPPGGGPPGPWPSGPMVPAAASAVAPNRPAGAPLGPSALQPPAAPVPPQQRYPGQPPGPPQQPQPPPAARQPPAPVAPSPAARPAVPPPSAGLPAQRSAGGWQLCYTSDPSEHNNDPVQAMTYLPKMEGLPGGDGHAGWLITSSRGLLNLWECSPGGGPGHPSLMTMHSQMTDYLSSQLAVEGDLGIMFAGSTDTRQNVECVTVHSVQVESLLAFKYRFNPLGGDKDSAVRRAAGGAGGTARQPAMNKVQSLHQLGGHWRSCCASVHVGRVLVYEAPAHNQNTASLPGLLKPRLEWKAHDSPITALHCSVLGGLLFTGAADGGVLLWNLRERQPSAVRRLSLPAAVTAVQLVNEHLLAASSADGKVVLWDLRRAATPLQSVVPDGSPVVDIRTSPVGDCLAVSTVKGLHTVDLIDYSGIVSPITAAPLSRPYLTMDWNERTGELYAAGHGGGIAVYRQRLR